MVLVTVLVVRLVLLARLLDWHLLLVAVRYHLVSVRSGKTSHALGFPLDHSVLLEAGVGPLGIKEDQIVSLCGMGLLAMDDKLDRVLGRTWLVLEFPSGNPALSEAGVFVREAGHFFSLLEMSQVGHHLYKDLDRLELGGLLGIRWKGLIDRLIGDRMEEFGIRSLEGQGRNPIVVNDGIHFGPVHGMERFCGDTKHDGDKLKLFQKMAIAFYDSISTIVEMADESSIINTRMKETFVLLLPLRSQEKIFFTFS